MDPNPPQPFNLIRLAIDAALSSRWDEALKLNKQIIKKDPQNIDALNRQARAYMEMGRCNLAKKYYCEVLKIDPYNPIALKNLKIVKAAKSANLQPVSNGVNKLSASLFLQEPGKTKIVTLLHICEPQKLSSAFCGMMVKMMIKNRKITIVDLQDNYLGVLPDDISFRILRFLRGGNKYELFIKSIKVNSLSVLIREVYRSKKFKNQSSFLENSDGNLISTELYTARGDPNDDEEAGEEAEEEQVV
ncbi:hypothetical protein HYZ05_00595 [Candidatus Daviesbacteria bacterium]|nr:hypothetical protein [Candidatus Daviesbacteria bacterium]